MQRGLQKYQVRPPTAPVWGAVATVTVMWQTGSIAVAGAVAGAIAGAVAGTSPATGASGVTEAPDPDLAPAGAPAIVGSLSKSWAGKKFSEVPESVILSWTNIVDGGDAAKVAFKQEAIAYLSSIGKMPASTAA